jgi:hypothetical protein
MTSPSNYNFNMVGDMRREDLFRKAFLLCLEGDEYKFRPDKNNFYLIKEDHLGIFWNESASKNVVALPYPMDAQGLSDFAWNWLKTAKPDNPYDGSDGSSYPGWEVFSNLHHYSGQYLYDGKNAKQMPWENFYCLVGVKATIAFYGK